MIDLIKKDSEDRMKKSIDALKQEFIKIRTGRAHTSLLDHVMVPYYGSNVPLNQVANVTVIDSRTLGVAPWEKNMIGTVEKALMNSDIGITPATSGTVIRLPLPPLTEERRRDMVKIVRHETEGARVAIRNIRRDANQNLKNLLKDKKISEDDDHRAQEVVQKLTDKYIADLEKMLTAKETELMEV